MSAALEARQHVHSALNPIRHYFLRPVRLLGQYDFDFFRPDLIAGLTVGVVLLPQAIAFALIAGLPPEMGLYAAIVASVAGALWGSSHNIQTGPSNAISLLVLSALQTVYVPGSPEFIVAAGMLALMVGVFQLVLGLLRLGLLVNFVSHSVIIGFASGAGLLIAIKQLQPLLGLPTENLAILETLQSVALNVTGSHLPTAAVGLGVVALMILLPLLNRKLPAALISLSLASLVVFLFGLNTQGVEVIGALPGRLPPLADLPLLNLEMIRNLSTGALAIGAIGLVQTLAIGRSIATQTGQRIDSNQEFVGQGMANIFSALFSGYPVAGSFSVSTLNYSSGARTALSAIISSACVVLVMLLLAPLAAFLPVAGLAGVLIVTGLRMVDYHKLKRIWQGTRGDAAIMVVTFLGTLFLQIETAVLMGILLSLVVYLLRTSAPRVHHVVPDEHFRHFIYHPDRPVCPQLGIVDILGDLYFGAVNHVEEAIYELRNRFPTQRYLLMRMHHVNHCDFSGIHMLESVVRHYRERGGDVYMVRVSYRVRQIMEATGFVKFLGEEHLIDEDQAIGHLFHRVLDPAVCIYECSVRVFKECQNLPKRIYFKDVDAGEFPPAVVEQLAPRELWRRLRPGNGQLPPLVVDVREPREFHQGHIPGAELFPLAELLEEEHYDWPAGQEFVLVCRSGRRSQRAAECLRARGYANVKVLQGGILAWESADLLEAVD